MTHDSEMPRALREAAQSYNEPPALSREHLDAMWSGIESEAFAEAAVAGASVAGRDGAAAPRAGGSVPEVGRTTWSLHGRLRPLLALAATLVLGVAIGRYTARAAVTATPETRPVAARTDSLDVPEPYHSTTSRYLGQTAALLATLPAEVGAGGDERFVGRAHDLLLTTRLLLDSPAATDPRIRTLLDDLELVLAQIVRLQTDQSREELDLIRQALEQRDVLPRLRTAVADISADD